MKITMVQTTNGSDRDPKGIALPCRIYAKGKTFDVLPEGQLPEFEKGQMGPELAKVFCEIKAAESADGSAKDGAPENKMGSEPETNKGRGGRSRR